MARTHSQDGPGPHPQDRPTMDSTWEKEARPAQEHLVANGDSGAEGDEPNLGRGTACGTRQVQMEADRRSLMSH